MSASQVYLARRRRGVVLTLALAVAAGAGVAQLPPPPEPPGNPLTASKANLGKVLFWDEQISSTRTVACGTCHFPSTAGEDPRSGVANELSRHPGPDGLFNTDDDVFGSPGVPLNDEGLYGWSDHFGMLEQVTGRRTGPAINAGYAPELFWEGRAPGEFVDPVTEEVVLTEGAALESQAVGPPVSDVEMADVGSVWTDVLARVEESVPLALSPEIQPALLDWIDGRSYAELFEEAFGDDDITAPRVAMAIASYERTQFTDETPFDLWLSGQGEPLTAQEQAGFNVFNNAGLCKNCHDANPPTLFFSDHSYRYTGVVAQTDDPGRMDVTGDPDDEGKMRVPTLRNLELRAPFMHNGRLETIEDVIEFYDQGGFFDGPNKDPLIVPLNLTQQEKDDLLAFLIRPLTDPRLAAGDPPFDRPTLYTESDRVPVVEDVGNGDPEPAMVAIEPPVRGNPSFTVGIWNGPGGATARLVIDDVDHGLIEPAAGAGDFADETIILQGTRGVGGDGFGSVSLAIADDPALVGTEWLGRWYVDDGGVSKLLRFTIFQGRQLAGIFEDGFESGDTGSWDATVD